MIIKKQNKNKQGCIKIGVLGACATVGVIAEKNGINMRLWKNWISSNCLNKNKLSWCTVYDIDL